QRALRSWTNVPAAFPAAGRTVFGTVADISRLQRLLRAMLDRRDERCFARAACPWPQSSLLNCVTIDLLAARLTRDESRLNKNIDLVSINIELGAICRNRNI